MTSDDLDRVERQLGVRLPAAYRALIQAYPVGLGASGPDYELIDDAEQLIAINRRLREHGFFGQPWPAHFFSFGGDGSGNEYYFDLRRDPSPVCFADHEGSLYSEQWPSLDAWLAERIREAAESQVEGRRRAYIWGMTDLRPYDGNGLSSREHWRASLWLCVMLLLLAFVLVPLLRDLPLGATTRTGLLAWLLVLLALYWLYAGMGFQPLLLLQLVIFSAAAVLLSTKAVLVLVGVERLSVLRRVARVLILIGATFAGLNLLALLIVPRWRRRSAARRG